MTCLHWHIREGSKRARAHCILLCYISALLFAVVLEWQDELCATSEDQVNCTSLAGFEEVIQEHFRIQKPLILQQCARWLQDSPTPQLKKRLRKAVAELRQELEKL